MHHSPLRRLRHPFVGGQDRAARAAHFLHHQAFFVGKDIFELSEAHDLQREGIWIVVVLKTNSLMRLIRNLRQLSMSIMLVTRIRTITLLQLQL